MEDCSPPTSPAFTDLPEDVVLHISRYIDDITDLLAFTNTNRFVRGVLRADQSLWEEKLARWVQKDLVSLEMLTRRLFDRDRIAHALNLNLQK
jgi:hypothetical protein